MSVKVMIEVDPQHEAFVRRAVAMAEEMEQLALTAADGEVFAACEEAVIEKGRRLQQQVLSEAVTRRIECAEKKDRSAAACAVGKRKIKGRSSGI